GSASRLRLRPGPDRGGCRDRHLHRAGAAGGEGERPGGHRVRCDPVRRGADGHRGGAPGSRPFIPAGPTRFKHQKVGLKRLLKQQGVGALVFDPGLGKTATTIDYLSVLALASGWEEVRVLVICPLAAVDTWVQ